MNKLNWFKYGIMWSHVSYKPRFGIGPLLNLSTLTQILQGRERSIQVTIITGGIITARREEGLIWAACGG